MHYQFNQSQLDKLDALTYNAYPSSSSLERPTSISDILDFADRPDEELTATHIVAGRLRFKNEMGKLGFGLLHSDDRVLQICVKANLVSEEQYSLWKNLDLGDWVWAKGGLFHTRRGDLTLRVDELHLYAKCLEPTPDKWNGLSDPEQRQRMRYADLAFNDEAQKVFRTRFNIIRLLRENLNLDQFVEVETPILQPIPGGATAKPFVTHHNALDTELFLRIAPELYLKRMLVGGFERVYELNRNFRNEGISTKHNPEFTMLEFYQAYVDFNHAMSRTKDLIQRCFQQYSASPEIHALNENWNVIRYDESLANLGIADPWLLKDLTLFGHLHAEHFGKTTIEGGREGTTYEMPDESVSEMQQFLFEKFVEPTLINPTFVTHLPVEISPLARISDDDSRVTDRFELFINGQEIANGFTELNNPVDQAQRFAKQAEKRATGDDEAMFFDEDYIKALSYGMPPAAGVGIGIDRLVMILTGKSNIRDVILFPTLKLQKQ